MSTDQTDPCACGTAGIVCACGDARCPKCDPTCEEETAELREVIAEALVEHTLAGANGGRPKPNGLALLDAHTRALVEKNAESRADAAMTVVAPILAERDARIAELEGRLAAAEALADRRWLAWQSTRRRARRHAEWWRLSEARKQVWVQRALRLEEQRAAVRSVLATWEHRTHHGDSGPMDLLADLQAAVRTRPAAPGTEGSTR